MPEDFRGLSAFSVNGAKRGGEATGPPRDADLSKYKGGRQSSSATALDTETGRSEYGEFTAMGRNSASTGG
ncbi:hypothetical protein, partial [Nocardia aobensis]|uniref:hypothetical protein n=1 Tax=Nocardia aobensis TaxID=257277 RepID=UPI001C3F2A98